MRPVDYSKVRGIKHLRGVAQSLDDENLRLRQERAEFEAALARERAEVVRERAEREAAEAEALRQRLACEAAEEEALRRQQAAAQLQDAISQQQEAAGRLQGEIKRLEGALAALQEQLDQRLRELYGRSTERRRLDTTKPDASRKKKSGKPRKGHGRTDQPALPKVEVKTSLTEDQLECDVCGGQLQPINTMAEEAELIGLEKRKIVLERHIRTMYRCACGECLKTAPGPLKLIAGGRYSLAFTVHVAYQKYFAHLPLERQAKMFKHEGLAVTAATLCDQLDALATALTNTYDTIWRNLQAEKVLRADETPWAVLSNGFNENEQFYAWVAVGSKYVAFRLLDTRSAEAAAQILGGFSGTLMVDGLTSYPAAAKAGPGKPPKFIVANCHAHARRPFVALEKYWPVESQYVLELYRQLYVIERAGKEPGADLGALRQVKSRPLIDELFAWGRAQQARPDILPSSGLAKAVFYLMNHEAGLRVFLGDPAVPIDNNESEQAVRPTVMGRLNYLGSRSLRGTQVHAIISTLVESAKRCDVPPEAYLLAAAQHALIIAGGVLLPDEFKKQLDAARPPPAAPV